MQEFLHYYLLFNIESDKFICYICRKLYKYCIPESLSILGMNFLRDQVKVTGD
jgi:hypothetical protein